MELKDREFLLELMEEHKVSGRQLARLAGWKSHTYLQRLLRGEVDSLDTKPALLIAYHLKTPVHRLFRTKVSTVSAQNVRESDAA